MSLGGGAYFEERNAKEGVPYDAASLPDMSAVFGPSKAEKEAQAEEEKKKEEPLPKARRLPADAAAAARAARTHAAHAHLLCAAAAAAAPPQASEAGTAWDQAASRS